MRSDDDHILAALATLLVLFLVAMIWVSVSMYLAK